MISSALWMVLGVQAVAQNPVVATVVHGVGEVKVFSSDKGRVPETGSDIKAKDLLSLASGSKLWVRDSKTGQFFAVASSSRTPIAYPGPPANAPKVTSVSIGELASIFRMSSRNAGNAIGDLAVSYSYAGGADITWVIREPAPARITGVVVRGESFAGAELWRSELEPEATTMSLPPRALSPTVTHLLRISKGSTVRDIRVRIPSPEEWSTIEKRREPTRPQFDDAVWLFSKRLWSDALQVLDRVQDSKSNPAADALRKAISQELDLRGRP